MKRVFKNINRVKRKIYQYKNHNEVNKESRTWLEKYGSLITTFILACITLYYAIVTHNISVSNDEMVKLSKKQFEQSKKVNKKILEDNHNLVSATIKQADISKRSLEYAISKDDLSKEITAKPILEFQITDKFGRLILDKDSSFVNPHFNFYIHNIGDADAVNISVSLSTFVHLIDSTLSEYYGQFGIMRPYKLFFKSIPKDSTAIATFEMEIFNLLNDSALIEVRKIEDTEHFYDIFEKNPSDWEIRST